MRKPKVPHNESDRLNELETYQLVGVAENADYDFITSMAANICGTKISLISLITAEKQWFLSHHGLKTKETSKDYSFCAHAINKPYEPFIVTDAKKDERFSDNPLTTGDPNVIFYAGVPLVTKEGLPLGSLCVIDDQPKQLTKEQLTQLDSLAKQTIRLFELRKSQIELKQKNEQLQQSNALLHETQIANHIGTWEMDIYTGATIWSEMVYKIHEVPSDFNHNKTNAINFYHPDYRDEINQALQNCIKNDEPFALDCILITAKANQKWVKSTGRKVGNKVIGHFQDITEIKANELKYKGIFNSTFSFIGFLNTEGILLEANDTAVNMTGIKREETIGKPFWECYWWQISRKTKEELKASFKKVLSGESVAYEVIIWSANKTPVTILFSMRPLFDTKGNVIYIVPEGRPVQEIVEARRKYKSVIDGTNVGTWEWNVQTGQTVFNERWAEIVGYTLEELAPISIDTWMKLAHPDDLDESGRKLNSCFDKKTEYYKMEARMKHKDGHWVWVFSRGKVFEWTEDGKPLMMYGTHQDITSRKNREIEIAYQKDILNALYKLSPIGIALNDYETGRFIDVNQKLLDPTGYSKAEFLDLSYWDVTPQEFEPLEKKALQQVNDSGGFELFEKEYIRKDGSHYPVALQGMLVKDLNDKKLIWSFIQDISKEKEAEKKLHEAISRLQAILDASTQVSIIATDSKGVITLFNSGAERMLGYSADEIIGKETPQIFHLADEMENAGRELSRTEGRKIHGFDIFVEKAKKGKSATDEWTYLRKDGSTFPALLSITAIKKDKKINGFLGVAADISELKKVQNEIKSLLELTQEQNNRLKNFAHIVSHNLRSHSSGLAGVLDIMKMENPDLDNSKAFNLANKSAENLKQTVKDLTEIVKVNLEQDNLQEIMLYDVIQKNIESLSFQIKNAGISIHNKLDKNLMVKGVPAYLDSIALNFITNAIKYRSAERKSYLKIFAQEENNCLILSFQDNGLGIDLKQHGDKLFGMYKTFHRHEDSRGVGLFITKNQIESMGGKIEVESKVNQGTTFKVHLTLTKKSSQGV